jgi:Uma2 family endonuclease
MHAILETIPSLSQRLTADDYFDSYPENTTPMALINGEVITMPAPSIPHQRLATRLSAHLYLHTSEADLGEVISAPSDVKFSEYDVAQPDLFFIQRQQPRCHNIEGKYWQGPPDLCIEILSPSTAKTDWDNKFELYQRYGVSEYWIVDPQNQVVLCYHLEGDHYQRAAVYTLGDSLESALFPAWKMPIQALFSGIDH